MAILAHEVDSPAGSGLHVLAAASGEQALEFARQHGNDISLVVLDMIMPGMSGSRTYDALQDIAPGIGVLLSSGYSIDSQVQAVLDRGCVGFIQKPFTLATLSAKLEEIL
jgi:two-component system, cell cycle sensor histidine kinase and response regulator CckA